MVERWPLPACSPATFAFGQATFTVPESGGSVLITATPTGSTGGNVTVDETVNGTGVFGTDYLAASGTLAFGPGEPSKTFSHGAPESGLDREPERPASPPPALLGKPGGRPRRGDALDRQRGS
jgi:Calx-beta domain-containing protein